MTTPSPGRSKHNRSYASVTAIKFVRKLPGGSQSILALCDDGGYYVVKMSGNPQGGNTLANELLGHQLIETVGLPVSEYVFVRLSHAFVTAMYPHGWFEGRESGRCRPQSGIHLGCRFVGWPDGECRTSDHISSSQIAAITNRLDFIGMLILDAWADHQDARQAVFYSQTRPGPLHAVFIDHGMMFGGKSCIFTDNKCKAFFFDVSVYRDVWSVERVEYWKSRIRESVPAILQRPFGYVPSDWYDSQHELVRHALMKRLECLDHLIEPYARCFT